jgi:methanogenic corrinoid protein MtbC1
MTRARPVEDLYRCLEALDPYGATNVVRDAIAGGATIEWVVTELIAPSQRRVGEQWQCGAWSIAQEHAATAIVDDLLGLLAVHASWGRRGTVALICSEEEWHVTPARMAALLWRAAGWRVDFMGGSTPAEHLRATMGPLRVDAVAISCTVPLALPGVARIADALADLDVPILGGGSAFGPDAHRAEALGLHGWAASAFDAPAVFGDWMDRPPDRAEPLRTDDEELTLELQLPELLAAAERRLLQRFPAMRSYDNRQKARTREDLDFLLRFVAVSLRVDDDRIFHDFLRWLPGVLEGHGVPPSAARAGIDALLGVIRDLPRTTALLASGSRALEEAAVSQGGRRGADAPP